MGRFENDISCFVSSKARKRQLILSRLLVLSLPTSKNRNTQRQFGENQLGTKQQVL